MKIYILEGTDYDYSLIIRVFKNKKKAKYWQGIYQKLFDFAGKFNDFKRIHRLNWMGDDMGMDKYLEYHETKEYKLISKFDQFLDEMFMDLGIDTLCTSCVITERVLE